MEKQYLIKQDIDELFELTSQATSIDMKTKGIETFKVKNRAALSPVSARKFMLSRNLTYPSQIISFQSLKGGSTKTSSLFNIAARLNQYGAKVLAVDLDMQGNLTSAFGYDAITQDEAADLNKKIKNICEKKSCSIEDAAAQLLVSEKLEDGEVFPTSVWIDLDEETTCKDLIVNIDEGLDLIPSSFDNSLLDYVMTTKKINLQTYVRKQLDKVKDDYDFILIDCNPALSQLNSSIALASDLIIIPVNPDKFSYNGLRKTLDEYEKLEENFDVKPNYKILYSMYSRVEVSSNDYFKIYFTDYSDNIFKTTIAKNTDVKNAIQSNMTIFDFPRANARKDFDLIALEILGFKEQLDKRKLANRSSNHSAQL